MICRKLCDRVKASIAPGPPRAGRALVSHMGHQGQQAQAHLTARQALLAGRDEVQKRTPIATTAQLQNESHDGITIVIIFISHSHNMIVVITESQQ